MENLQNELGGRVTRRCGISQTTFDAQVSKGERFLSERVKSDFVEYLCIPLISVTFCFIVVCLINVQ